MPRNKTILVADDEPHIIHVVRFKLEAAGFEVLSATNGSMALELAFATTPDLVVTDVWMPLVSGIEIAKRLRRHEATKNTPVIILTGREFDPRDDLAETNVACVLAKPFSPRGLLAKVNQLLNMTGRPMPAPAR